MMEESRAAAPQMGEDLGMSNVVVGGLIAIAR